MCPALQVEGAAAEGGQGQSVWDMHTHLLVSPSHVIQQ